MGSSISDDIRELLDRWLKTRDNRTLQSLADSINGIKYNSIRRIHIGQVMPSMETCLMMLNHIASPSEAADFMQKHFPVFGKFYQRLDGGINKVPTTFATDLKADWEDFNSFVLLSLAMMKKASPENIRKFLGDAGMVTADDLCRKGVLTLKEENLVMANGAELCVTQDPGTVLTALSHLIKIFRARMQSPFVNFVNVTESEAETLRKICQEMVRESAAIIDNSSGGDQIVALSVLFGNLTEGLV